MLLGIYPHWGLWRRLFNVKRMNSEYATGGMGISIKEKNAYFLLEALNSVHTWRKEWFYLKDCTALDQQYGLAPFDLTAWVARRNTWQHVLSAEELAVVEPLVPLVERLVRRVSGSRL